MIGLTWGQDGIAQLQPLLNRAAVNWVLCLIALITTTFVVPPNPKESYDSDAIWNTKWARLPQSEQPRNRGPRNLMFWWVVMVAASTSLFIIFR